MTTRWRPRFSWGPSPPGLAVERIESKELMTSAAWSLCRRLRISYLTLGRRVGPRAPGQRRGNGGAGMTAVDVAADVERFGSVGSAARGARARRGGRGGCRTSPLRAGWSPTCPVIAGLRGRGGGLGLPCLCDPLEQRHGLDPPEAVSIYLPGQAIRAAVPDPRRLGERIPPKVQDGVHRHGAVRSGLAGTTIVAGGACRHLACAATVWGTPVQ